MRPGSPASSVVHTFGSFSPIQHVICDRSHAEGAITPLRSAQGARTRIEESGPGAVTRHTTPEMAVRVAAIQGRLAIVVQVAEAILQGDAAGGRVL